MPTWTMERAIRWAYLVGGITIAIWAALHLLGAPYTLPVWSLVLAGLVVGILLTAHYAGQYTS